MMAPELPIHRGIDRHQPNGRCKGGRQLARERSPSHGDDEGQQHEHAVDDRGGRADKRSNGRLQKG